MESGRRGSRSILRHWKLIHDCTIWPARLLQQALKQLLGSNHELSYVIPCDLR